MVVLLDSYQLERPIDASIVAQKWRIDEHHADELPANGLVFSCRERAPASVPKNERSRARSGQLQHRVRRSGIYRSSATRMRRPHDPGITPSKTGVRSVARASGITPAQPALI